MTRTTTNDVYIWGRAGTHCTLCVCMRRHTKVTVNKKSKTQNGDKTECKGSEPLSQQQKTNQKPTHTHNQSTWVVPNNRMVLIHVWRDNPTNSHGTTYSVCETAGCFVSLSLSKHSTCIMSIHTHTRMVLVGHHIVDPVQGRRVSRR